MNAIHVWGGVQLPVTQHVWKSEVSLWKLVLSFHLGGSRSQTQVSELGRKCLYLLAILTALCVFYSPLHLWTPRLVSD